MTSTIPPDILIQVRRMWIDEGMSASEIGRTLCRTSNSVIGIVHRNGWHRDRSPETNKRNLSRGSSSRKVKNNSAPNSLRHLPLTPPPVEDPLATIRVAAKQEKQVVADVVDVTSNPTRFVDLSLFQCRWIDGDPAWDAMCCGGQVMRGGSSYCARHYAMAYVGVPKRRERDKPFWK